MSGFFNIFGKAKADNGGGAGASGGGSASGGSGGGSGGLGVAGGKGQKAIASLQSQVKKKEGRVKYLEAKCARLNKEARKLMMKKPKPDKRGAMQKIKNRKVYEKQIDQMYVIQFASSLIRSLVRRSFVRFFDSSMTRTLPRARLVIFLPSTV